MAPRFGRLRPCPVSPGLDDVAELAQERFAIADLKSRVTAMRMTVDGYLVQHMQRKLTLDEAAMAKRYVTEALTRVLDAQLQRYGGTSGVMKALISRTP
jgi:acyl-CoA dehydrogenase